MNKMKNRTWSNLTRTEKYGAILYPELIEEARRKEMEQISRGEKKLPPQKQALLSDAERGAVSQLGGTAKRK
jgi:hypothetical protein